MAIQTPSTIANSYRSSYTNSYFLAIESCECSLKSVVAKISLIISPIIILITLLADLIVAIAKCICCKKNNQPSLLHANSHPTNDASQKIGEFARQTLTLSAEIEMSSTIVNEMEFDTPQTSQEAENPSPSSSPKEIRMPLYSQLHSAIPLYLPEFRLTNERFRERNTTLKSS